MGYNKQSLKDVNQMQCGYTEQSSSTATSIVRQYWMLFYHLFGALIPTFTARR